MLCLRKRLLRASCGMEQDAVDCPAVCKIGVIRASQGYLSNATSSGETKILEARNPSSNTCWVEFFLSSV